MLPYVVHATTGLHEYITRDGQAHAVSHKGPAETAGRQVSIACTVSLYAADIHAETRRVWTFCDILLSGIVVRYIAFRTFSFYAADTPTEYRLNRHHGTVSSRARQASKRGIKPAVPGIDLDTMKTKQGIQRLTPELGTKVRGGRERLQLRGVATEACNTA